jgi:predicted nucleic acid-binding protein
MIVVDTSVWIDRLRDKSSPAVERLNNALDTEIVVLGDVVLLELLQGARDDTHSRNIERSMAGYMLVAMLDHGIAVATAANYRALRAQGITIRRTIDLIIGTWCIEHNCPLLHRDRDFAPMVEHLGLREY